MVVADVVCFLKRYWHVWVLRDLKVEILLVEPKVCGASILAVTKPTNLNYK